MRSARCIETSDLASKRLVTRNSTGRVYYMLRTRRRRRGARGKGKVLETRTEQCGGIKPVNAIQAPLHEPKRCPNFSRFAAVIGPPFPVSFTCCSSRPFRYLSAALPIDYLSNVAANAPERSDMQLVSRDRNSLVQMKTRLV